MYAGLSSLLALAGLVGLAAVGWFWNDSLQARERMTAACTRLCKDMDLQFLDETVALAGLRLTRSADGWLAWRRLYVFEFSESGSDRWQGRARLTGRHVESVQLDHPRGVTLVGAALAAPHSLNTLDDGHDAP